MGGTETLSKIALVQADCNIDGTVDEKDLELLKNYLTNAKKELADGVNLYALGMLTEGYGDLNEDGVCDRDSTALHACIIRLINRIGKLQNDLPDSDRRLEG